MPKPYPKEFRDDVVAVARSRRSGTTLKQIAADFGISESCLANWLAVADRRRGPPARARPARRSPSCERPSEADPPARAGERGPAPSGRLSLPGEPAGKMMYPLVRELAVDGIPVTVTCRVLKLVRQDYYRWLAAPVTDGELDEAHLANALFDAHRDDPEFGYRFLADEVRGLGFDGLRAHRVEDLLGQRLVVDASARRRPSKTAKVHTPAHDDLVKRRVQRRRPEPSVARQTSPSTRRRKGSSTSAPSRTSSRTGSSATRSTSG